MSFGKKFGDLVKKMRGVEGLTQQALAVKAFGDEGYKTRISELENGRVARPQARTIDALVIALKITEFQLNEILNQTPHPLIVDSLFDFFDVLSERLDIEIAIKENGKAVFYYSESLKVQLERAEFFTEEKMLVFLSKKGSRRPIGLPVGADTAHYIQSCEELLLVQLDKDHQVVVEGPTIPLKIIH